MSHQLNFADGEFNGKRRQTRKEIFLSRMEQLLPWLRMLAVIEPLCWGIESSFRDIKDDKFGMGMGEVRIGNPARRTGCSCSVRSLSCC